MFDARVLFLGRRRTHSIPSGPYLSRLCDTTDGFRARLFRSWIRVRGMHLELESFHVLGHSMVHLFPLLAMAGRTDVLAFCLWCEDLFFLDAFPRATTSQLHALSCPTHPRQHVARSDTSSSFHSFRFHVRALFVSSPPSSRSMRVFHATNVAFSSTDERHVSSKRCLRAASHGQAGGSPPTPRDRTLGSVGGGMESFFSIEVGIGQAGIGPSSWTRWWWREGRWIGTRGKVDTCASEPTGRKRTWSRPNGSRSKHSLAPSISTTLSRPGHGASVPIRACPSSHPSLRPSLPPTACASRSSTCVFHSPSPGRSIRLSSSTPLRSSPR